MEKGLSPIITVILVLLIAISVTVLAMIYLPRFTLKLFPEGLFNESYIRSRGCLNIEDVKGLFGFVTIKNCGKIALSDFKFFIDGKFISNLDIGTLEPSQLMDFYDMPIEGGKHQIYVTANYAESPPYEIDVPYWECMGGEPVLVSDWYVSRVISCICSYNSIIPVNGNVYVIENGSLSLYNCILRFYSNLYVRNNGFLNLTRSRISKTQSSGVSYFEDNSTIYLLNSAVDNPSPVIQDETNVTAINSYLGSPYIYSNIHHRLSVSNFNGQPSGSPITNYFKADDSNFTVNFTNVSFNYVRFTISDNSNTTISNSYFYPFTISSDYNHNLTIRNFVSPFNDHFKAEGSDFEFKGVNFQYGWPKFEANDNSNNTIISSILADMSTELSTSSYLTNTIINSTIYGNMYFSESSKNTFINSRLTNTNYDWVIGSRYGSHDKVIINFSNTTVEKRISFPSSQDNSQLTGNITIFGNVTFAGATVSSFTVNVSVTRYFPTIIKDSGLIPFPIIQPAAINITNKFNQSVWGSSVSGGSSPITYYIENPKILFNSSNYKSGNFTMKVSQVCENKTDLHLLNNTPLEFTLQRAYNYDGTNFNTQAARGLAFDNSNFWIATSASGGNDIYQYTPNGNLVQSFYSGLGNLRDIASNRTYLWLLDSSTKKVYRYRTADYGYDNWNFSITDVNEPYAVDFDGEYFWVLGSSSVYKYDKTGSYTGFSFSLDRLAGVSFGDIVAFNGNIWILTDVYSSDKGRGVFRYKTDGTYDNWYFDIFPPTTSGYGLAYNGTYFWVMNSDGTVYRYSLNENCLEFMKECDEFITFLPYTINKNNTRYCMLYSLYIGGQTSITFFSGTQNTTLDCFGYNINGNQFSGSGGIYLSGSNTKNNTIRNCYVTNFYQGIYLYNGPNNNIITSSAFNNNTNYGIGLHNSSSNTLINNTINNNLIGIYLDTNSNYNKLTNNTVNVNVAGFVFYSSYNNTVTGGSAVSSSSYDYYLRSAGAGNNFTNTNFTAPRKIYFYDTTSWFNYNNEISLTTSTFGKTDVGSTSVCYGNYVWGSRFQSPDNGIIKNLTIYITGSGTGRYARTAVYSDNNGAPNSLLGESASQAVTVDGWQTFTNLNIPILEGEYYWLTWNFNSNNLCIPMDTGQTNQEAYSYWAYGPFPSTFGTPTYYPSAYSIYATYIPTSNIWLKTSVSSSSTTITRKLINWNQTLMMWNDTSDTTITARYNITGLIANSPYAIYDSSIEIAGSPIRANSKGEISFIIDLPQNQEHEIMVKSICDYFIFSSDIPYTITDSNKLYCLVSNITNSASSKAISFAAQNSTLDCLNNFIDGRDTTSPNTYGIYSDQFNTSIQNCNITDWHRGVLINQSDSSQLTNMFFDSNIYGMELLSSSNVRISNSSILNSQWDSDFIISASNDFHCNNELINVNGTDNKPIAFYNYTVDIKNWNNNVSYIILCNADNSIIDNVTMDHVSSLENNGIVLQRTDYTNLTNIYIKDFSGISIQSSTYNRLINVTVLNGGSFGIYLNSPNNALTNITVNDSWAGIVLTANNNYVTDSKIYGNSQGLRFYGGNNNNVTKSIIMDNSIGVYMSDSSSNYIYNNLFNNTANFQFAGTVYINQWNTTRQTGTRIYSLGTEIGGNYWTNPSRNGYSDICLDTDNDGFCDSSYILATNNIDYLPLSGNYSP